MTKKYFTVFSANILDFLRKILYCKLRKIFLTIFFTFYRIRNLNLSIPCDFHNSHKFAHILQILANLPTTVTRLFKQFFVVQNSFGINILSQLHIWRLFYSLWISTLFAKEVCFNVICI
eukprot:TRINITY_DN42373_c0_g2_i1.p3 TRINITY_DN42373_c0_g2~~TRINITY_DN42373_c0_g2_i1.p3  ORF type:complete len:119 (-),score=5.57 TRINITY_DN42373_c0_g2_i1:1342-1698(-)